jgi:hypothetical protein
LSANNLMISTPLRSGSTSSVNVSFEVSMRTCFRSVRSNCQSFTKILQPVSDPGVWEDVGDCGCMSQPESLHVRPGTRHPALETPRLRHGGGQRNGFLERNVRPRLRGRLRLRSDHSICLIYLLSGSRWLIVWRKPRTPPCHDAVHVRSSPTSVMIETRD